MAVIGGEQSELSGATEADSSLLSVSAEDPEFFDAPDPSLAPWTDPSLAHWTGPPADAQPLPLSGDLSPVMETQRENDVSSSPGRAEERSEETQGPYYPKAFQPVDEASSEPGES